MNFTFYLSSAIAVAATALAILHSEPIHALLSLTVSLLAVAMVLFTLGASLAAALEVIIYAGAVVVLFVFAVMMLSVRAPREPVVDRVWLSPRSWAIPAILAALLLAELVYVLSAGSPADAMAEAVGPRAVGLALFGPYLLAVELAALLLLSAMVGAYHLARSEKEESRHAADTAPVVPAPKLRGELHDHRPA